MDFSEAAVAECRRVYGKVADFIEGDDRTIPSADVIVASNILEHLADHRQVLESLLRRARDVFVAVPFRERLAVGGEHVNRYDLTSFDGLPVHCRIQILFHLRGEPSHAAPADRSLDEG
jgi:hypothetical protein